MYERADGLFSMTRMRRRARSPGINPHMMFVKNLRNEPAMTILILGNKKNGRKGKLSFENCGV